jgi:hypothetical protein
MLAMFVSMVVPVVVPAAGIVVRHGGRVADGRRVSK